MITQKQLAKQLGVSQQAVSFALTGGGRISDKMRKYIIEEAQKAGLRSLNSTRLIRTRKTNTLAFVVPENSNILPGVMLRAMRPTLRERDLHLILFGARDSDFSEGLEAPRIIRELCVDGFIAADEGHHPSLFNQIQAYKIPSIRINYKAKFNCAYPNEIKLSDRLVRELTDRKKGRVLYWGRVDSDQSLHYSVRDRLSGFQKGIQKTGRTAEIFEDTLDPKDIDSRHAVIRAILQRKRNRPKIVITYDTVAAEIFSLQALMLGLRIPEDILICCFAREGVEIAGYGICRLYVPINVCGKVSLKMLLQRIDQPDQDVRSVAVDDFLFHEPVSPAGAYV